MARQGNRAVTAKVLRAARKIRLLVCDVDGVLTDGSIRWASDGSEIKVFHVVDGSGIAYLRREGYGIAIISGRSSPATERRARELKIDWVYQGWLRKVDALEDLLRRTGVSAEEVCFMGDDLADLCLFDRVGLSVAVASAVPDVRRAADWVTTAPGGKGAVREVSELLLKARGLWDGLVKTYRDAAFEPPASLRRSVTRYGKKA